MNSGSICRNLLEIIRENNKNMDETNVFVCDNEVKTNDDWETKHKTACIKFEKKNKDCTNDKPNLKISITNNVKKERDKPNEELSNLKRTIDNSITNIKKESGKPNEELFNLKGNIEDTITNNVKKQRDKPNEDEINIELNEDGNWNKIYFSHLPLKKRRISSLLEQEDKMKIDSYPSKPMISIAELMELRRPYFISNKDKIHQDIDYLISYPESRVAPLNTELPGMDTIESASQLTGLKKVKDKPSTY